MQNTETLSEIRSAADFFIATRNVFAGLRRGRPMAFSIFRRDLLAEYAKARFGMLWDFVEPIVIAVVFMFLRSGGVIQYEHHAVPYPIFVIYGVLLWQTFSDALLLSLNVMIRSRQLITHVRVPPETLTLSVFYRVLFNASFRIVVMLGFSIYMQAVSPTGFVKFLLLFPVIILLGMSAGVFLAPLNVIYRDIGRIVQITLRPLMYLTPVFFILPGDNFLSWFQRINPIAWVLNPLRSLATENIFVQPWEFVWALVMIIVLGVIGSVLFHLSIRILGDKI